MSETTGATPINRRRAAQVLWALPAAWTAAAAPAGWMAQWHAGALRGFTTDNVPRLTLQALDALRATGARLARVGLLFEDCASCAPTPHDARSLQAVLDHAASIELGVVVLGAFEHGLESPRLWHSADLQAGFVTAWGDWARRFGRHPALAGIDLLNEPNPPWTDGRIGSAQAVWHALAERSIHAIRAEGCAAPVIFQPVAGGNVLGLRGLRPLADRQVVYSIHFYTPHDITHQQVSPRWTRRIPYPAGAEWQLGNWDAKLGVTAIDAARLAAELGVARAFQLAHGVPIYVGEFGCVRWAPQGSALRWTSDCLDLFTRYGWSWSFHSFRTWPGWDAEIVSDDPAARTRSSDAPVMARLRRALVSTPQAR